MNNQNSNNSQRRSGYGTEKSRGSFSRGRTYGRKNFESKYSNEKSEYSKKRGYASNGFKKREGYNRSSERPASKYSHTRGEDNQETSFERKTSYDSRNKNNGRNFARSSSYTRRENSYIKRDGHNEERRSFHKNGDYKKRNNDFKSKSNYEKNTDEKILKKLPVKEISQEEEKDYSDQVEGRNAVIELLESDKDINKLFVLKGEKHGSINKILGMAKDKKIVIIEVERKTLETMAQSENPQGVIAIVPPYNYCEVDDILNFAKEKEEEPFIIILDGLEDTHNLGSIIRTAETAGAHGIIIPKRRACGVNATVYKVSAGAVEHMHIARVNNITETISYLKQKNMWICGTDIDTDKYYYNQDLTGPLAIVIGSEGFGISKLVKENCDFLVKIPMKGKITSLNASVSAGIVMYEAVKQRINK